MFEYPIDTMTHRDLLDRYEFFAQVIGVMERVQDEPQEVQEMKLKGANNQLELMRAEILRRMEGSRA